MSQELSSEATQLSTVNQTSIIVVGESGSGKSSIIRLITGNQQIPVSRSPSACTTEFKHYSFSDSAADSNFVFVDTPPLPDASDLLVCQRYTTALIQYLKQNDLCSVSLLLFVMKPTAITQSVQDQHEWWMKHFCSIRNTTLTVPSLLVITHCDSEDPPARWWTLNSAQLHNQYGWDRGVPAVSVTAVDLNDHAENRWLYQWFISRLKNSRQTLLYKIKTMTEHSLPVPIDLLVETNQLDIDHDEHKSVSPTDNALAGKKNNCCLM